MTKPRKDKPDSPKYATLPPSGLTMESLYDSMTEHFTKLEEKAATKDCIYGLMENITTWLRALNFASLLGQEKGPLHFSLPDPSCIKLKQYL